MFSTIFLGPVFIMIYILFLTNYWYLGILYLVWVLLDLNTCNRGGRKGWLPTFVRNWTLWKHFANFFPVKMIKTAEFDRNKNYLVGSHPHGVLSAGAFSCFATEGTNFSKVFPGMIPHLLTLQEMFFIPLFMSCGPPREPVQPPRLAWSTSSQGLGGRWSSWCLGVHRSHSTAIREKFALF